MHSKMYFYSPVELFSADRSKAVLLMVFYVCEA